jgi:hypothetical protein
MRIHLVYISDPSAVGAAALPSGRFLGWPGSSVR